MLYCTVCKRKEAFMKITENSLNEPDLPVEPEISPTSSEPLSEKEKLKIMSGKDKVWYIWEYYKFPIFGTILGIILIWTIASSVYRSGFETVLHCMYLNNLQEELNTAPLDEDFAAYLNLGKKQMITTESSYITYGDNITEFTYASMAKISALIAAKDLDIMICDRENFEHFAAMDGGLDLEEFLPAELLARVSDRLVYMSNEERQYHAYGIDLSGTEFAAQSNLTQDPPILLIVSNSVRTKTVFALLDYIFAP